MIKSETQYILFRCLKCGKHVALEHRTNIAQDRSCDCGGILKNLGHGTVPDLMARFPIDFKVPKRAG